MTTKSAHSAIFDINVFVYFIIYFDIKSVIMGVIGDEEGQKGFI